jgi:hypothetical protein
MPRARGAALCLRAGLAEVVDHNLEYGEEGVLRSTMREGSFPFGNGTGKLTLVRGYLPLKFSWITYTKRLRYVGHAEGPSGSMPGVKGIIAGTRKRRGSP